MKKLILLTFILLSGLLKAQVPTPIPVGGLSTNVCLNTTKVYGDFPINPAATYVFAVNNGEIITLISAGTQAQILWDNLGTFTVTITKTINGCTTTLTTTVVVTANPTGVINNLSVCEGSSSVPLTGTNLGNSVIFSGIGVVGSTFDPTGLAPGIYNVSSTGTDSNGCTVTSTGTVTITPLPTIIFNSN